MDRQKEEKGSVGVLLAGYAKRFLEGYYDELIETELGQKIVSQDKRVRYGIELILNLLTVFFDQKLAGNTTLKRFVKEVLSDTGPEMAKRIVNGAKEVRGELKDLAETPQEKLLIEVFLELENKELFDLLNWFYSIEPGKVKKVLQFFKNFSSQDLRRIVGFDEKKRNEFIGLFVGAVEKKEGKPKSQLCLEIEKDLTSLAEEMDRISERLEQKKGGTGND